MKKLFINYTAEKEVIRAVETSESTYWETIANMGKESYHQVILVDDILLPFAKEVFQKGGIITEVGLYISKVEEKDPYYEAPTPNFWQRLRGKPVDPTIEAEHHRHHQEETLNRMNAELKAQAKLDELVASFVSGDGSQVKLEMIEDILENHIVQLSFIRIELNQEELITRTNGVYESNQEDGKLGAMLQKHVLHSLSNKGGNDDE